jgi:hypothetical protein
MVRITLRTLRVSSQLHQTIKAGKLPISKPKNTKRIIILLPLSLLVLLLYHRRLDLSSLFSYLFSAHSQAITNKLYSLCFGLGSQLSATMSHQDKNPHNINKQDTINKAFSKNFNI